MPMVQNLFVTAGADKTLTLYARDDSNVALSLSAATISWRVGKPPRCPGATWPIFTKTGTVTDAANGVATVALTPTDTQYMRGDYEHEAWVTISGLVALSTIGRFRVRPYIMA